MISVDPREVPLSTVREVDNMYQSYSVLAVATLLGAVSGQKYNVGLNCKFMFPLIRSAPG